MFFFSTLVATRPHSSLVKKILTYEIPGILNHPFNPNIYENISKEFPSKVKAIKCYKSELENFPHPRSIESSESLAKLRGMQSSFKKAESFELIRSIHD